MTATTSRPRRRQRTYKPTGEVGRRLAAIADLQKQLSELQIQLDVHREHLLHHMNTQKLDRIEFNGIVLSRRVRHNWTYSAATERDAMALRQAQKWEQTQGLAEDRPTVYVALSVQQPEVE